MLDSRLRPLIDPPLEKAARVLAARGISANSVTVTGFVIGCFCFAALWAGAYGWALGLMLLNRLCDGLDGAVARQNAMMGHEGGITDLGGYLDIVTDFIFYAGVVFFFAMGRPDCALYAAFLIFSYMGTASSFLTYAVIAAKRGISTEIRGKKSLYYLGGLAEGAETIIVMALICLFPIAFPAIALVFGAMCWITTASRITAAVSAFRPDGDGE